ncbi:MAG: hypothetical protein M1335_04035 [Chloroflexi bacterium]|nr:hypothetical protein [Chloroflexota bacterium]
MRHNTLSWNFYGEDIENHQLIEESLVEAAKLGFGGVQAQLRDYAYQLTDPKVVAAMKRAAEIAHQNGLEFWLHLDPRDAIPGFLTAHPEARQRIAMPMETTLQDDHYAISHDYSYITSDHKQHCSYDFDGVERVFAYQATTQAFVSADIAGPLFADTGYINFEDRRGTREVIDIRSLVDITGSAQAEADQARKALAVSGQWAPPAPGEWKVLVFVRLMMNTFDYASETTAAYWRSMVDLYYREMGGDINAVFTDEPGHPYRYHYLTSRNGYFVGEPLYAAFATAKGYDLRDKLYALVHETSDGQAGKVRCDYYTQWGDALVRTQKMYKDYCQGKFGPGLKVGIHATASEWSAADLQKGALDYWKLTETTTDGYTDGKHHDRCNGFFHVTLAKSLAKLSDTKLGYTQTWDMLPTADSENYWSIVAAIYGLRWEPLGYKKRYFAFASEVGATPILEARWANMSSLNQRMCLLDDLTSGGVGEANVAAVFPLETMMRLGDENANELRRVCHLLSYQLQAAHYQTDFFGPEVIARAGMAGNRLVVQGHPYDTLVYPFPVCMPEATYQKIEAFYRAGGKILLFGCPPSENTEGEDLADRFGQLAGIRPVTRMFDYIDPDPTTPYTGTVSFLGELTGIPTVNIREGMFVHVPWQNYFWPVIPTTGLGVAVNLRWMPNPIWVGVLKDNQAGGKLLLLGMDCTCVTGAEVLFDHLLHFLGTPRLVEAPAGIWTSLIRRGDKDVVLCAKRDGLGVFSAAVETLGHAIDVDHAKDVVALAFDREGRVSDLVAYDLRSVRVDGKAIICLDQPADVVLRTLDDGSRELVTGRRASLQLG